MPKTSLLQIAPNYGMWWVHVKSWLSPGVALKSNQNTQTTKTWCQVFCSQVDSTFALCMWRVQTTNSAMFSHITTQAVSNREDGSGCISDSLWDLITCVHLCATFLHLRAYFNCLSPGNWCFEFVVHWIKKVISCCVVLKINCWCQKSRQAIESFAFFWVVGWGGKPTSKFCLLLKYHFWPFGLSMEYLFALDHEVFEFTWKDKFKRNCSRALISPSTKQTSPNYSHTDMLEIPIQQGGRIEQPHVWTVQGLNALLLNLTMRLIFHMIPCAGIPRYLSLSWRHQRRHIYPDHELQAWFL